MLCSPVPIAEENQRNVQFEKKISTELENLEQANKTSEGKCPRGKMISVELRLRKIQENH